MVLEWVNSAWFLRTEIETENVNLARKKLILTTSDIPKEQAGFYPGWTGIGMESVIIPRAKHMTYLDIHVMNNPIIWFVLQEQ